MFVVGMWNQSPLVGTSIPTEWYGVSEKIGYVPPVIIHLPIHFTEVVPNKNHPFTKPFMFIREHPMEMDDLEAL